VVGFTKMNPLLLWHTRFLSCLLGSTRDKYARFAMEPTRDTCNGACKYDHPPGPLVYDGNRCHCTGCVNAPVCGEFVPANMAYPHGRGQLCHITRFPPLSIRPANGDLCPTCDRAIVAKLVAHPAGCKHEQCVDCFREAWIPHSDAPTPEAFGMEPRPATGPVLDVADRYEQWIEQVGYEGLQAYEDARNVADDLHDARLEAMGTDRFSCPVCHAPPPPHE